MTTATREGQKSSPAQKENPATKGPALLMTGAANGIGRATARVLAGQGYRLGLIDREPEPLVNIGNELRDRGTEVTTAVADVRDRGALAAAVASIEAALGTTDVLLACAGVGGLSSAIDLDLAGFRLALEVNVLGVAHTIEAVLPGMYARGSGHIVALSSVAGYRGLPWMPGYSASKAALTTYLEGLRPGLKRRGVRITTVYPGFVRTRLTESTPFRKPVPMMEPERAAYFIAGAVRRGRRDAVFPLSAALGMGFLRRMPGFLFDLIMDRAGPKALTTEF